MNFPLSNLGWIETKLGDILTFNYGKGLPARNRSGDGFPVYGSNGIVGFHNNAITTGETIIIGRKGSVGEINYSRKPCFPIDTTYFVDKFYGTPAKYWFYLLKSKRLDNLNKATAIPGINRNDVYNLSIPLAPLNEQKRIADKLDSLFGKVQSCQEHLESVPIILERFRQSVLTEAMSGRLTADWRGENKPRSAVLTLQSITEEQKKAKIKVRGGKIEPQLEDFPRPVILPESWAVSGFDGLAAAKPYALKAGPFGSALKKSMYSKEGYKIYGQEQVISGDENIGEYYIDENKYQKLITCAVKPGDILISLVGTIGKVLVLSQESKPGIINPRLVKMSLDDSINREFISLYISSPLAQDFFRANSHGGTMDILNLGILRKLPILIPSSEEQQQIVFRVRALFSLVDEIEKRYSDTVSQVEKIIPSLLEKSFRGELVPQDPDDEPASVLLESIRAERESQKVTTKKSEKRPSRKVKKMTRESVIETIIQMPSMDFSFVDLHEIVKGDYETLKEIVFELLGEETPIIQQVFDASSKRMVFVRRER